MTEENQYVLESVDISKFPMVVDYKVSVGEVFINPELVGKICEGCGKVHNTSGVKKIVVFECLVIEPDGPQYHTFITPEDSPFMRALLDGTMHAEIEYQVANFDTN